MDVEGNKIYARITNQRSDAYDKVFAPNINTADAHYNVANIEGLDENNVTDIDTAHMTAAETEALWEFFQQFGVSIQDLTICMPPLL